MIELHIAPMQGYTQSAWRHFRRTVYGGVFPEYTPFIRVEKGEVRQHDLRDYTTPLNEGASLAPQVIFRDMDELRLLVDTLSSAGANRIDLNCGCPFPPQVKKGRGAGVLLNPELMEQVADFVNERTDITFSLKMRLGVDSPDQWEGVYDSINRMSLYHVTVHPRIARQQYKGELDLEQFERLLGRSENPVVFNGDIRTPEDIHAVTGRFPSLVGVMVGRGLCARPSLFTEYHCGHDWSNDDQLEHLLKFHSLLLEYYRDTLCGDTQVLQHIQSFWHYHDLSLLPSKTVKQLLKATTLSRYLAALPGQ